MFMISNKTIKNIAYICDMSPVSQENTHGAKTVK